MSMIKAIWNGTVVAESEETIVLDGTHYFPITAIHKQFFLNSNTHTTCSMKGVASYYHLEVEGKKNTDSAFYYPTPKDSAKKIAGYVAFWKGVKVG